MGRVQSRYRDNTRYQISLPPVKNGLSVAQSPAKATANLRASKLKPKDVFEIYVVIEEKRKGSHSVVRRELFVAYASNRIKPVPYDVVRELEVLIPNIHVATQEENHKYKLNRKYVNGREVFYETSEEEDEE